VQVRSSNATDINTSRRVWAAKDLVLILLLLAFALFLIFWQTRAVYDSRVCVVLYEREAVLRIPLETDAFFSIEQLPNVTFEVRDGRVRFAASDCPDQVCVHTGLIGEPGQFAACLPNRVAIQIESNDEQELDAVI